ncbi:MAG: hypothetical protein CL610_23870 [Anaerolineaceae bacterium]|nr:hypothetical protein [Anaerolineaceae bacterium]
MPAWFYINDANQTVFVLAATLLVLAQVAVSLNMVISAAYSIMREQKTTGWDLLIMTHLDAHRLVWGKWWAVVRNAGPVYLLFGLPRVGLAYMLMTYLNIYPGWLDVSINAFNRPFYYMSFAGSRATVPIAYHAAPVQIGIAALVLVVLCLAELGLMAAVGLCGAVLIQHHNPLRLLTGMALRLTLIPLAFMSVGWIDQVGSSAHDWLWRTYRPIDVPEAYMDGVYIGVPDERCAQPIDANTDDWCVWARWEQAKRHIIETIQVAVSTLADGGILLAANMLRPIAGMWFIGRQVFSAFLGCALFVLLTRLLLWLAKRKIATIYQLPHT